MTAAEQLTYEDALARLDETLRTLENGKISLEDAVAAVARGREYLQMCQRKLVEARQRIESLPVTDPGMEDEAPHPATLAELRANRDGTAAPDPQGEIPF